MTKTLTALNLSGLDLNLLYVLHVVLEERSVARAAARLHVTPPAVSNALARLRDALGDPLLVRHGRGLTPTPRAVGLAPALRDALGTLQNAIEEGRTFDPATTTRTFTLACSDGDQLTTVPRVALALERRMPRARLRVVSLDVLASGSGLAGGDIDLVFAPAEAPPPDAHAKDLYEDDAVLVVRRDHPAARRPLTRDGFNALKHVDTWLVGGKPGVGHQMAERFLARHGLHRVVSVAVPSFTAAAMVAAATDHAAGMPRRVAEALAKMLPLKVLDVPAPPMRMRIQMLWHERTHRDEGGRAFRELVAQAARR